MSEINFRNMKIDLKCRRRRRIARQRIFYMNKIQYMDIDSQWCKKNNV